MAYRKKISYCFAIAFLSGLFIVSAATSLSPKEARQTIANIPGFEFDPNLVRIKSIDPPSDVGRGGAIVEAEFSTAYRLEKREGKWQVMEMRLGDGHWADMQLIITAVRNEKIKRTRERLSALGGAISGYYRDQGYYPRARDIVELLDLLTPRYINKAERDDLWSTYLQYSSDGNSYRLQSLGPDAKPNTGDEITLANGAIIENK